MTPQRDVLHALAARGAMTSAGGTTRALQTLQALGCVDRAHGGQWHLTGVGVDELRAVARG